MEDVGQLNFERYTQAAEGFIELGMYLDADAELEEIAPERRDGSEVLALRVKIYRALEKWDLMQVAANTLVARDPMAAGPRVSLAYAVRRAGSLDGARAVLVQALYCLPDVAILHYKLACCECRLGNLAAAKDRLKLAVTLEPRFREKALDEEDLAPLWEV